MAKIKNTMTVSLEEFGKKAGEYALDEFEYKGLTIRQWADKITSGEYQLVKHGRWIRKHNSFPQRYFCTECGGGDVGRFAFCHHCGVRMEGDSE